MKRLLQLFLSCMLSLPCSANAADPFKTRNLAGDPQFRSTLEILRARDGFEVDIEWKNGKLTGATIRADKSGRCSVAAGLPISVGSGSASVMV